MDPTYEEPLPFVHISVRLSDMTVAERLSLLVALVLRRPKNNNKTEMPRKQNKVLKSHEINIIL